MDIREHESVGIDKLANSLTEEFNTLNPSSQDCCIYRVPQSIRCLNPSDYTPQIVSIGPLHHRNENLKAMEEHKIRYLQYFLRRSKVNIGEFLALIKENEAKLRGCYEETIDLESDDFVRMILLDAVFLLEYFLRGCGQSSITYDDRIFRKPGINIWNDLWLVENQLPLFILHDLFDLAKTGTYSGLTLITITSWFREGVFDYVRIHDDSSENKFYEAEHFVDLLRLCLQPTQPEFLETEVSCEAELHQPVQSWPTEPEMKSSSAALHQPVLSSSTQSEFPELQAFQSSPTQSEFPETVLLCASELHLLGSLAGCAIEPPQPFHSSPPQTKFRAPRKTSATKFKASDIPCATELHQAGVKFDLGSEKNLLDITFSKGILKIPRIELFDDMERFYRNILAFENMNGYPKYFNDYVLMMCYLVNTAKDAELFIQNKIIGLGNGERLSAVFHSLDKNCFRTSNFHYSFYVGKMREHCDSPWHKWKATLKQDYFSNPWASISVIAAVVLLVLTIIQTACSIIAL